MNEWVGKKTQWNPGSAQSQGCNNKTQLSGLDIDTLYIYVTAKFLPSASSIALTTCHQCLHPFCLVPVCNRKDQALNQTELTFYAGCPPSVLNLIVTQWLSAHHSSLPWSLIQWMLATVTVERTLGIIFMPLEDHCLGSAPQRPKVWPASTHGCPWEGAQASWTVTLRWGQERRVRSWQ